MDFQLKNKVAVITGSAQGIGEAIARGLASEGVNVSLCDMNAQKGETVRKSLEDLGVQAIFSTIDVGKTKQIHELVEKTIKTFGRIDILVNNAGICPRSPLEELSEDEWDKVLTVNLKGLFFLSQSVFTIMKGQKYGRIVNVASMTIRVGGITVGAHYTASKGGVQALTKAFARNGAQYNITANALAPGFIATEIYAHYNEEQLEAVRKQIPLGYLGTPEDVANLAVFLASDRARYITGVTYDINGGVVMW